MTGEREWAVCELMGHVRMAGIITEVERFGSKMGRLEIPQEDGSFTTQFFGGGSVYRITPVSEAVARDIAKRTQSAPVEPWDYPKQIAGKTVGSFSEEMPEPQMKRQRCRDEDDSYGASNEDGEMPY